MHYYHFGRAMYRTPKTRRSLRGHSHIDFSYVRRQNDAMGWGGQKPWRVEIFCK